jgi:hypothetical protein
VAALADHGLRAAPAPVDHLHVGAARRATGSRSRTR